MSTPLMPNYGIVRDLAQSLRKWRANRPIVKIEANALGERTWITVTAKCRPGADRPVVVRACRAQRFEHALDSCADPQPVRSRAIWFLPTGTVTLRPGEERVRWEARVVNEHVRREAREGDLAATISVYGEDSPEAVALSKPQNRKPVRNILAAFVRALDYPTVTVQAVLETEDRGDLVTKKVLVPPRPPLEERIRAFWSARQPSG